MIHFLKKALNVYPNTFPPCGEVFFYPCPKA